MVSGRIAQVCRVKLYLQAHLRKPQGGGDREMHVIVTVSLP